MSAVITKDVDIKPSLHFDSEEAFEAWCDEDIRAEYVNGEVIMHSPPGTDHEDDVMWLGPILRFFIDRDGLGRFFGSNTQIRLPGGKRRLADLAFVAKVRLQIVHPT